MPIFEILETRRLTLNRPNRLANMYMLSPFVWTSGETTSLFLRAVPRRDDDPRMKISEVWYGSSEDGFNFAMEPYPTIFPGPELYDVDGCEDPTVLVTDGQFNVWYSGYNAQEETGRLIFARGPDRERMAKVGLAIGSRPPFTNPKEAELLRTGDGWTMFFEYADDGLSRIGQCRADSIDGPWTDLRPAALGRRDGCWDDGHMSPGALLRQPDGRVLAFYNGATAEAHWRIGWAVLDAELDRVVERCDEPLIVPPDKRKVATDIAFISSVVEVDDGLRLYFSFSDMDLRCAVVRVRW